MRRTIVIGDVHGCREELEELLATLAVSAEDQVFLVGDLVAKGPDSVGVLRLVRERGLKPVRGNHDQHLVNLRRGNLQKPPRPAVEKLAKSLSEADWAQLEAMPLWLRVPEQNLIVVHGGIVAGVPLEQQSAEHLLNLRSITPDGKPSKKVDDGAPWASAWPGPERVVFGHDAVRGLQQHPHATGLDTGCVYGRSLTALVLPEDRLVSVPARRVYSEPGA